MTNIVIDFSLLEALEELVVGLVDLLALGDEYLLHHLLDHVVLLAKMGMLTLHLGLQLLIRDLHLIDLLLQLDLPPPLLCYPTAATQTLGGCRPFPSPP